MHQWQPAFTTGPLASFWCFVDINYYTCITCCLCCSPALQTARSASVFLDSVHLCPLCQKNGLCFPSSVRLLFPNLDACLCDLTTPSLPFMASSLLPVLTQAPRVRPPLRPRPPDLTSRIFSEMEAELLWAQERLIQTPGTPILISMSVVVMWGRKHHGRDATPLWHSGLGGCMFQLCKPLSNLGSLWPSNLICQTAT